MTATRGLGLADGMFQSTLEMQEANLTKNKVVSLRTDTTIQFYRIDSDDKGTAILLNNALFANPIGSVDTNVNTPVNALPADLSINVIVTPTLSASAFSGTDLRHLHSVWNVYSDVGLTVLVYTSGNSDDLTSHTTTTLPAETQLWWTVQYIGVASISEASAATSFTPRVLSLVAVNYNNTPFLNVYDRDGDLLTKLDTPDDLELPTGTAGTQADWDGTGTYLALARFGGDSSVEVYKRDGFELTKLTPPSDGNTFNINGVAFTSDGGYLAFGGTSAGTEYLRWFKRIGDTFTNLPVASLPEGILSGCQWDGTDTYLAVGNSSFTFGFLVYKRTGDTLTKITPPQVVNASMTKCGWSSDSLYVAAPHNQPPYLAIYKRSGDVFAKITDGNVITPPTGSSQQAAFSNDSTYLAVGHATAPFVSIYKRDGDTFTKLANPDVLPDSTATSVAWDRDGIHLYVSSGAAPFFHVYKRDGDTFTKLADTDVLPTGAGGIAARPRAWDI